MENEESKFNNLNRDIPNQPQMPPIPNINSIPPLPELKDETLVTNQNNGITPPPQYKPEDFNTPIHNNSATHEPSKGFDQEHLSYAKQQEKYANENLGFPATPKPVQQNAQAQPNSGNPNPNPVYSQQPNYSNSKPYVMPISIPNSGGILALGIISILSLCCCAGFLAPILSIIALAMIPKAKRLYNENPSAYTSSSYGSLKAGQITAIIGLAIAVLFLIYLIVMIIIDGNSLNEVNKAINEAWNETGY
jgi:hypothetical protein